ncbi:MAG: L-threonylcarbamoyladenylate synthase [Planctomycetota bacterium]
MTDASDRTGNVGNAAALDDAVRLLRSGGLVVFPTETVYGLGADALNPDAVAKVYELKQRPANNPLIVHVADTASARSLVASWPSAAELLAERFWPGPLTMVLDRAAHVPHAVSAGGPTIAVRCPDHPLTLELLRRIGRPLVGPSANASGTVSPTTAEHVRAWLGDRVPVLDGGPCARGIESTVVRLGAGPAAVLRPGVITPREIGAVVAVDDSEQDDAGPGEGPVPSPGMLRRHYSPRTPVRLFEPSQRRAVLDRLEGGASVVVLSPGMAVEHERLVRMPADPEGYARELYAALHRADGIKAEAILIELPQGESQVWNAIRDRLRRAASG